MTRKNYIYIDNCSHYYQESEIGQLIKANAMQRNKSDKTCNRGRYGVCVCVYVMKIIIPEESPTFTDVWTDTEDFCEF